MLRVIVVLALLVAGPAAAQQTPDTVVDLELVLLADATGSIDPQEIRFQRQGYAQAMTDPRVLDAIASGPYGRIAVAYVEWANHASQDVVVDWMVIDGPEAAGTFATRLEAAPRRAFGRNAIGAALLKGVDMIETNRFEGFRRVIDLSADSANNWNGPPIEAGRQAALAAGITINGLAVLCRGCVSGRAADYDLETAFEERLIGGAGAFVVTADGDAAFADAVRAKLILEIAGPQPAVPPIDTASAER
jgi:hypothetical protein